MELKATSNCWICEGWTSIKFQHKPADLLDKNSLMPFTIKVAAVYLNLSIDNYKGDLMNSSSDNTVYSIRRMVPPIKVRYYYTVHYKKKVGRKILKLE